MTLRVWRVVPDGEQQSEIVRIGQPEVEQDDVGRWRLRDGQPGLRRVGGFGDDVTPLGEGFSQRPPDQRLVIHHQHSQRVGVIRGHCGKTRRDTTVWLISGLISQESRHNLRRRQLERDLSSRPLADT
jgi:hypothetical protein